MCLPLTLDKTTSGTGAGPNVSVANTTRPIGAQHELHGPSRDLALSSRFDHDLLKVNMHVF